jgi:uroporphyrinogen decarboxylase
VLDFDFDAAILFSDLLFPLEALGFGLSYDAGPPALDATLSRERIARFRSQEDALARLQFQQDAMRAVRRQLPDGKGLIGFVGGPWTLFVYAMEGTHSGPLARAKASLDLYREFADRLVPLLVENIRLQFDGGADIVMIFDTAAGEVAPATFGAVLAGDLARLAAAFPGRLGYYAKGLARPHIDASGLGDMPWAGLGFDMRWDLAGVLSARNRKGFVQGNFDPAELQLTGSDLERAIDRFIDPIKRLDPAARQGWICGLGHGVLPGTPESSVRTFVHRVRGAFAP